MGGLSRVYSCINKVSGCEQAGLLRLIQFQCWATRVAVLLASRIVGACRCRRRGELPVVGMSRVWLMSACRNWNGGQVDVL